MGELSGRVAAITGGTRGIGRAIAEAFLRDGASVVVNGRSAEKGEGAIAEIRRDIDAGDRVRFVQGDATVKEDCERLIDETVAAYGRIDILVNNAGGSHNNAPVAQLTDEAMEYALDGQPVEHVLVQPQGTRPHDPSTVGADHQHLVARGQGRQARNRHLRHRQARRQWVDEGDGTSRSARSASPSMRCAPARSRPT